MNPFRTALPLFVLSALLLVGCATTAPGLTAASLAPGSQSRDVLVNFSNASSLNHFGSTTAVRRTAPDAGRAAYALSELIAGPTPQERSRQGLFSEWNGLFTGETPTVGGPDFTLTLVNFVATVRFTRAIASPGIGADARVKAEITATLAQFETVKSVVILRKDGSVFGEAK